MRDSAETTMANTLSRVGLLHVYSLLMSKRNQGLTRLSREIRAFYGDRQNSWLDKERAGAATGLGDKTNICDVSLLTWTEL